MSDQMNRKSYIIDSGTPFHNAMAKEMEGPRNYNFRPRRKRGIREMENQALVSFIITQPW